MSRGQASCYWGTPAPMDSQQGSKPCSASNGSRGDLDFFFFLCLPNIFIYFSVPIIYLFVSLCFDTPCTATGVMLDDDGVDDAPSPPSLPFAFNAAAVGNQTALKQIDVLFNIVVTSSQGPRASALVTTAGLLSLAPQWLTLCWSLQ